MYDLIETLEELCTDCVFYWTDTGVTIKTPYKPHPTVFVTKAVTFNPLHMPKEQWIKKEILRNKERNISLSDDIKQRIVEMKRKRDLHDELVQNCLMTSVQHQQRSSILWHSGSPKRVALKLICKTCKCSHVESEVYSRLLYFLNKHAGHETRLDVDRKILNKRINHEN